MKCTRRVIGLGVALLAVFAICVPVPTYAATDVNNFTVQSFDADYYLTRGADKRSHLSITEKIVVQFPPYDQNHGIERAIPDAYDGHTVRLGVASVRNEWGKHLRYTTYGSNGNTVLRIGDPDRYVQGIQTYVINYDVHDVTKLFGSHDELYWDTNGTDWGQTFGSVAARLHLSGDLAKKYSGEAKCFEGSRGSTNNCAMSVVQRDNETVLAFHSSRMLYAGENVTFVAAFNKGTFAKYQPTTLERWLPILIAGWLVLGLLFLAWVTVIMIRAWRRYGRSPEGRGTIVPEYIPPKDLSVMGSSAIIKRKGSDITAQILDLAVRHYIRIYETETGGKWFRNKRSYELELSRKQTGLRNEERQLLAILFGDNAQVGQRVALEGMMSKLYKETTRLEKDVKTGMLLGGYLADMSAPRMHYYKVGALMLLGGLVIINPFVFLAGFGVIVTAAAFHPLTEIGVERRDYLRGLEMYMKLAEAERIRVLQSPEGAVKTRINPKNHKRMVELYERLLPYAVVFGLEKEWAKQLAPMYQQSPDWYVGNWSAFNAGLFVASLNNFALTSNNTFAPPTSSSSSGFSSSGGFSGGGGGGGGGGGW